MFIGVAQGPQRRLLQQRHMRGDESFRLRVAGKLQPTHFHHFPFVPAKQW